MNVHKEVVDDVVVLSPSGRIDSNSAMAFEVAVKDALPDAANLILDFSDVPYISSAGLRVVLNGAKELTAKQGGYALCALNDSVKDVFELSGFDTILKIVGDRAEALAAVKG